jgi:selenocysteine lyase/cysteine desulfurase
MTASTLAIEAPSIATQSYPFAHSYFNAAAFGLVSKEASGRSRDAVSWDVALESVLSRLETLFEQPVEFVTLFHNTTAAVQRVLWRVSQVLDFRRVMLLTTDLEYPGIIGMIDNVWRGPVAMVELAKLAWEGRFDELRVTLKQAILLTRPRVVYISHIARALGCPLLDESLAAFIKEVDPQTIVVVDGAQSLGNVKLSERLLNLTDAYVGSGHKWLCCPATLGVVCSHPRWQVADPAQAYSRRIGSGGTGNIEVLRSSIESLGAFCLSSDEATAQRSVCIAEHNRTLATLFCTLLRAERLPLVPVAMSPGGRPHWPLNGIAVVQVRAGELASVVDTSCDVQRIDEIVSEGKVMATQLTTEPWVTAWQGSAPGPRILLRRHEGAIVPQRIDLRLDGVRTPLPAGSLLRFCFHHYHSSADVHKLVARLRAGLGST